MGLVEAKGGRRDREGRRESERLRKGRYQHRRIHTLVPRVCFPLVLVVQINKSPISIIHPSTSSLFFFFFFTFSPFFFRFSNFCLSFYFLHRLLDPSSQITVPYLHRRSLALHFIGPTSLASQSFFFFSLPSLDFPSSTFALIQKKLSSALALLLSQQSSSLHSLLYISLVWILRQPNLPSLPYRPSRNLLLRSCFFTRTSSGRVSPRTSPRLQ